MKCRFCGDETKMTVRNEKGMLFNCCKKCKEERKLIVSVIYKS